MKRNQYISVILAVCFLAFPKPGAPVEKKEIRHWYRLEIQTGESTYECFGSSLLDEKEFADQLAGMDYVLLDDLVYLDSAGKVKSWQEWDPRMRPRMYVNPAYVIFFSPLKGDPRKTPGPGKKAGK